jgi:uncharacterized cupin superfamily protein
MRARVAGRSWPRDRLSRKDGMSAHQLLTHLAFDVNDVELEPWPIPRGENGVTIHGDPEFSGRHLYRSDDGTTLIGIERLGPCTLTGVHAGETIYLLQGRVTAKPPGGDPYTLTAGDFCWFPAGVEDVWEIEETYVKLFVTHVPQGLLS